MSALRTLLLCGTLVASVQPPAWAAPQQPPAARAVRVEEHLGAVLPHGLRLTEVGGRSLRLDQLQRAGRPVLLVLAYARCAMLCSWVLQGVATALPQLRALRPGEDYLPVVVSIDPAERPATGRAKQAALLRKLGHAGESWRLPYLIGSEATLMELSRALGFHYAWDERSKQYAHPAVIFVLTPELRIARYLYGVQFPAPELAEALRRAGQGSVRAPPAVAPNAEARFTGRVSNEAAAILRCFRFETGAHRYARELQLAFQLAGAVLLCALFALIFGLLRWERRRKR